MSRKTSSGIMFVFVLMVMSSLAFISSISANDTWVWVKNTVTGYYGEAVVGTGDAVYIARKNSFYRYNPADNSWNVLADPPNPDGGDAFKTGTALAWDFNKSIYTLYGAATSDSRRWFYCYSISSNSWEALANTPADQGEGDALTWVATENCTYATIGGEQRLTHLMRYNSSTDSWSDAPADPPEGMGDGASLVWTGDDFLYALRGEFDETSPLYNFWRYSLTDDIWTEMADIPADGHDGGTGGVGDGGSLLYVGAWLQNQTDYIYALSGNQAYPDGIPDNRTYRYSISVNSWERLSDLPFGVGYYVGCRLGYADGQIYAWQGTPSTWEAGGDDLAYYVFSTSEANNDSTGHVVINEVELNPAGNDNYLSVEEWAELYNPTTGDVDISGWRMSTTHGTTVTITIPQDTTIPADGYYVYGRGSQWLDNNDESVVLEDSEGIEVDSTPIKSDNDNDNWSWQRYPNGQDSWHFQPSTKGSTNGGETPQEYTLEISCTIGGTTDPAPGTYTYSSGTEVTVTATTEENYQFDHWELDGENAGSQNPLTITMDANHTLHAVFQEIDTTVPIIVVISPENKTYTSTSVPLSFTVDEPVSWIGYSLDEQANETITGNTTLTGLNEGGHYLTVHVNDTSGNMGASHTVYFTVDTAAPNITDVSQIPSMDNVQPEDEVKVNATVIDGITDVKQVTLNYTNGNGTWINRDMTNLDGNIWNGTIPAFPDCTYVNYTVAAEDNVGNTITTEEALGYQYQYHVIPEFPAFLILPLFMIATLLIAIFCNKKTKDKQREKR